MERKQQQAEDKGPIQTGLTRLPLPMEDAETAIRVNNRLATVPDSERAADLFSRILRAVRAAREEKSNGRK